MTDVSVLGAIVLLLSLGAIDAVRFLWRRYKEGP